MSFNIRPLASRDEADWRAPSAEKRPSNIRFQS